MTVLREHILRRPRSLYLLQKWVYTKGGPYWDQVDHPPAGGPSIANGCGYNVPEALMGGGCVGGNRHIVASTDQQAGPESIRMCEDEGLRPTATTDYGPGVAAGRSKGLDPGRSTIFANWIVKSKFAAAIAATVVIFSVAGVVGCVTSANTMMAAAKTNAMEPAPIANGYTPAATAAMDRMRRSYLPVQVLRDWSVDFLWAKDAYRECKSSGFASEQAERVFMERMTVLESRYPDDYRVWCLKGQFFIARGIQRFGPEEAHLQDRIEKISATYRGDRQALDSVATDLRRAEEFFLKARQSNADSPLPANNLAMIRYRIARCLPEHDPAQQELARSALELAGEGWTAALRPQAAQNAAFAEYFHTLVLTAKYFLVLHKESPVERRRAFDALARGEKDAESVVKAPNADPRTGAN